MLENSFWKCELGTIPSAKAVASVGEFSRCVLIGLFS